MNSNHQWRLVDRRDGEEAFHYTSCGLDDIFLVGGFTKHETNYGQGVSIVNVEGLHRAIAETLIASEERLNGKEIRFLRKEMNLTQEELAALLKISPQQVARWEKGECEISGPAEILLRALFKQHVGTQPNVRKISEQMSDHTKHSPTKKVFESIDYLRAA